MVKLHRKGTHTFILEGNKLSLGRNKVISGQILLGEIIVILEIHTVILGTNSAVLLETTKGILVANVVILGTATAK